MATARPTKGSALATAEPRAAARAAGLRYVSDTGPGIRRLRAGRGFRYVDPEGRPLRDPVVLRRIRRLAIPPAWRDVWICPLPHGHIQATGRDARGRKQYRYHPQWVAVRDENKYARLLAFAAALPHLRARVEADLAREGLPRAKVLATLVRLLDLTAIRIGNPEYARTNASFGLTTLHSDHVEVRGARLRLRFRGKSGKEHDIQVDDRRVARIVQRLQDLPGQELFQYRDAAGALHTVASDDVNAYIQEATGGEFTAKDFRTWTGTVLTALALRELGPATGAAHAKRQLAAAVKRVAAELGNTMAVCRRAYIHPAVIAAYREGVLLEDLARCEARPVAGLRPEECAILAFLERRATAADAAGQRQRTRGSPRPAARRAGRSPHAARAPGAPHAARR
jgi:DNA topoisomerase-1